jgi:hypothetical protein
LNQEPSARHIQPIVVGVDPGSKKEALVVKSTAHTYLNIQADAVTWVKDAVQTRHQMRRARRFRKTPCRPPRFSPLEIGKRWFYTELDQLAPVQTRQGWETKQVRETVGVRKSLNKLAETFSAHCVDAWMLAWAVVGGSMTPDNVRLLCVTPLRWHRRQLHRLQPEPGGPRKPYGGTRSLGFTRGTLLQHPKYGVVYVGVGLRMGGSVCVGWRMGAGGVRTRDPKCAGPRVIVRWRARLLPIP